LEIALIVHSLLLRKVLSLCLVADVLLAAKLATWGTGKVWNPVRLPLLEEEHKEAVPFSSANQSYQTIPI
jgi:hypothetical protein